MKRIISNDVYISRHSPEKLFAAVSDISTYHKWWGNKVKVKIIEKTENKIGSKVEVRASGGWFNCEILSMTPFTEVRTKYFAGVQKGEGVWKIEKLNENETKLSYSIDLEPNGIIPRFLSNFINFSKLHSSAMEDLFSGLEEYLSG